MLKGSINDIHPCFGKSIDNKGTEKVLLSFNSFPKYSVQAINTLQMKYILPTVCMVLIQPLVIALHYGLLIIQSEDSGTTHRSLVLVFGTKCS